MTGLWRSRGMTEVCRGFGPSGSPVTSGTGNRGGIPAADCGDDGICGLWRLLGAVLLWVAISLRVCSRGCRRIGGR